MSNCTVVLFGDEAMAKRILEASVPKKQKALGRQVKNFDVAVWKDNCKRIVKEGNMAKVRTKLYKIHFTFFVFLMLSSVCCCFFFPFPICTVEPLIVNSLTS